MRSVLNRLSGGLLMEGLDARRFGFAAGFFVSGLRRLGGRLSPDG